MCCRGRDLADHARVRLTDEGEIAWNVERIRENLVKRAWRRVDGVKCREIWGKNWSIQIEMTRST